MVRPYFSYNCKQLLSMTASGKKEKKKKKKSLRKYAKYHERRKPHSGWVAVGGRRLQPRSTLLHWAWTIQILGAIFFFFIARTICTTWPVETKTRLVREFTQGLENTHSQPHCLHWCPQEVSSLHLPLWHKLKISCLPLTHFPPLVVTRSKRSLANSYNWVKREDIWSFKMNCHKTKQ